MWAGILQFFALLVLLETSKAEVLSEDFSVKWRTWNNSITFHIAAKTKGWVALGFNDKPQMKGADFVLAGLADNKGYIYDLHDPKGHTRPVPDGHQDYKLIWAQENDTHTFVTIRRPFNTNDKEDHIITDQPINLLWAFNEKDAKSSKEFAYHGPNTGAKSLVLLNPEAEFKFLNKGHTGKTNPPKAQ